ncbi:protein-glutamate O-methyltransferase [Erythrobacter sp. NAP1]|uniref:CheR family methyltransferase n=1 Tax=Erythrobacter sp. NAP1 TaxID=237727 RepID=UPI000068761C|nr:protein-glutamate O-methyltransferase CheR [Erythrobacter sp. NAP1]EAQ29090.1 protein-glutamate O-methyltransferase [Erythrobacter sp. NAP1]
MEVSQASYQIIADLLAARTGQHLSESRRWRVGTALSGVFREHGISNLDQLVCLLDEPRRRSHDRDLATEVVEALLNNETYFFRDKPTFDQIPDDILPELAQRRRHTKRLSIWCAGCSTGQEVHSLAMLFEDQKALWDGWTIDILGTDVSHRAIRTARTGLYSQFEVQRGLGVTQMLRHFEETPGGWQILDHVRQITRFQQHNVLAEPPARARFDLVLCRNVLLYFDADTRAIAFERLASAMARDGFLMLGAGETVVGQTRAFSPSGKRTSIYELPEQVARSAALSVG